MSDAVTDAVTELLERFDRLRSVPKDRVATLIAGYADDLADLPEQLVVDAIVRLRKTRTFLPAVAEIRRQAIDLVCALPTEEQAWREVKRCLADHAWETHPLILETAQAVGIWELRDDEKGYAQRRFRELYYKLREEAIGDVQAGVAPLASLAIRQVALGPRSNAS